MSFNGEGSQDTYNGRKLVYGTPPSYGMGRMVQKAAQMAESLAREFPRFITGNPNIMHPALDPLRQYLDEPPYEYPPAPWIGGRCKNVLYRVDAGYDKDGGGARGLSEINGTVSGTYVKQDPGSGLWEMGYSYVSNITGQTIYQPTVGGVSSTGYIEQHYKPVIYSVERVDGLPDTCGNPFPEFPPDVPDIDIIDRVFDVEFSPTLVVPVNFVYIRPQLDVNVDVNIALNAPITINLPDLNINFNFNAGGINISFGGGSIVKPPERLPDPRPVPPQLPPERIDLEPWTRDEALDALDLLLDIRECACEDDPTTGQIVTPVQQGGIIGTGNKVVYAEVEVTQLRSNNRGQSGAGAPNVEFCGWAWFRYPGGTLSERMPVDATLKRFYPVGEPNSFCFTLQSGNLGFARLTYSEPV